MERFRRGNIRLRQPHSALSRRFRKTAMTKTHAPERHESTDDSLLSRLRIPHRVQVAGFAFVMIAPALLLFVLLTIYPVGRGLWISFHRWDGVSDPTWVGGANYKFVVNDEVFWNALKNTVLFAIVVTVVKNLLGLLFALLLNSKIRGQTFFRTAGFMPVTFSFVVIGVLWSWIYNPTFGLLNAVLESLGLSAWIHGWLSDPRLALWSVMCVDIWKWTGLHIVIFLAGLQGINKEYQEAATVDGASRWQGLTRVTLPLLSHVTAVSVFLSILGAFVSSYDVVYVMTEGGPFHSTEVVMTWIVTTAFRFSKVGKANAMSMILFVVAGVLGFLQYRIMSVRED